MSERVSVGIAGLDEILGGGFFRGRSYLLVGAPGTGKTLTSLQWLMDGDRRGEKGLFITLVEPVEHIRRNAGSLGWDTSGLQFVDLNPTRDERESEIDEYKVFPPSEVERTPMWQGIYEAVREADPDRVVIDSVTQLRYLSTDDYQFRKQLLTLVTFLRKRKLTALLAFEPTELKREASVALACDGVICLHRELSPNGMRDIRKVQVDKFCGSNFMSGRHPMRITGDGIRVFPHRIEKLGETKPSQQVLSSGIDKLDHLIGGGLNAGTTTLLTGPIGAGKSTVSMQFLTQAAQEGRRAVYYTFEESTRSIIARADNIGQPVREHIDQGMLQIVHVDPAELYPEEFLDRMHDAVENERTEVVAIDSLRGYTQAMAEFGSLAANVQNMIAYLNRVGVTTLVVNEMEQITGDLVSTSIEVGYLADSVLILRYAEYNRQLIKVISCLKKRYGSVNPALCRLEVTSDGISVSDELTDLTGILSGTPTNQGNSFQSLPTA